MTSRGYENVPSEVESSVSIRVMSTWQFWGKQRQMSLRKLSDHKSFI